MLLLQTTNSTSENTETTALTTSLGETVYAITQTNSTDLTNSSILVRPLTEGMLLKAYDPNASVDENASLHLTNILSADNQEKYPEFSLKITEKEELWLRNTVLDETPYDFEELLLKIYEVAAEHPFIRIKKENDNELIPLTFEKFRELMETVHDAGITYFEFLKQTTDFENSTWYALAEGRSSKWLKSLYNLPSSEDDYLEDAM